MTLEMRGERDIEEVADTGGAVEEGERGEKGDWDSFSKQIICTNSKENVKRKPPPKKTKKQKKERAKKSRMVFN